VSSHWYEICVRGEASCELLTALGTAARVAEPVETILVTEPVEVATLYQLLGRIANLGLELHELRRLPSTQATRLPAA
jgi:hypothetical protein